MTERPERPGSIAARAKALVERRELEPLHPGFLLPAQGERALESSFLASLERDFEDPVDGGQHLALALIERTDEMSE